MMNKDKTLVLIDTSSILYIVISNCSKDERTSDNFKAYKKHYDDFMQGILDDTGADYYIAFGDGWTSFRKQQYSEFKGDRKSKPTPKFMKDLKQYAKDKWNVVSSNIFESDDLCLIHAHWYRGTVVDDLVFTKVIVASPDSDLPQDEGTYFDYGYRKKKISLKEAFLTINKDEAERRLWSRVIIKGHNNKLDYLVGCGIVCASKYLESYTPPQLKLATLNAYIQGIDKKKHGTPKNIKGYGLLKGVEKFRDSFVQTYLIRTFWEAKEIDPDFELVNPLKVELLNTEEDDFTTNFL